MCCRPLQQMIDTAVLHVHVLCFFARLYSCQVSKEGLTGLDWLGRRGSLVVYKLTQGTGCGGAGHENEEKEANMT